MGREQRGTDRNIFNDYLTTLEPKWAVYGSDIKKRKNLETIEISRLSAYLGAPIGTRTPNLHIQTKPLISILSRSNYLI